MDTKGVNTGDLTENNSIEAGKLNKSTSVTVNPPTPRYSENYWISTVSSMGVWVNLIAILLG